VGIDISDRQAAAATTRLSAKHARDRFTILRTDART
jgi:hypothetical protein